VFVSLPRGLNAKNAGERPRGPRKADIHERLTGRLGDFLLDKPATDVQWNGADLGGVVLNMIVGAFLAFVFVGLPLAIMALFIASIIDRRGARPPKGVVASAEPAPSAFATSRGGDRRRRIVYGQHAVNPTAAAERGRLAHARGRKA
jgi:hypothetical protein